MNKRNTRGKRKPDRTALVCELSGLALFLTGLFVCISLGGQDAGILGEWIRQFFGFLFGMGAFVPALFLTSAGIGLLYRGKPIGLHRRFWLAVILYFLFLSSIHQIYVPEGRELMTDQIIRYGGILGGIAVMGLRTLAGSWGTAVFLAGAVLADVILLTHWSLSGGLQHLEKKSEKPIGQVQQFFKETAVPAIKNGVSGGFHKDDGDGHFFDIKEKTSREEFQSAEEEGTASVPAVHGTGEETAPEDDQSQQPRSWTEADQKPDIQGSPSPSGTGHSYRFPPLSLLKSGGGKHHSGRAEVEEKAKTLENTLQSFGIHARISDVSIGPAVTRYELEPAPGVKVSRIVNLSDDIALQLAATDIRMEAPIPGKSAVGIEVPNQTVSAVSLREVLESSEFRHGSGGITVGLGKDISGKTVITDLTKMPHLLIAGSTGSGKSVCINTLITSILFHADPSDVKMILIDPKVVELSVYNGIPHLLVPVVTAPKKAAGVLHWAVKEMEGRYKSFADAKVRDIRGFNQACPDRKMPFIVIIIDELADLMMVAPDDVEDAICRLAQMARAAGIHLVLATQRPSVDVITGIIKANIPSRISFAVSSQVDSRTILDMAGAEKLIGKGDMLFYPIGAAKPRRVQGAFISDAEVEAVTGYIKKQGEADYEEIDFSVPEQSSKSLPEGQEDSLLEEAVLWIMDTQKASVSMLQRRFRIGYTRAGRLMDTMETMGIVGPAEGAKPREIRMTKEQVQNTYFHKEGTP